MTVRLRRTTWLAG